MSDYKPKDMPPGPWRCQKVALDGNLLLRWVTGENVVVEHLKLPPDADVINCRQNGTDTELYVKSATFDLCDCLCRMPTRRVNFTTGG